MRTIERTRNHEPFNVFHEAYVHSAKVHSASSRSRPLP
ncbi:hypothetical protein ACVWZ8_002996 [Arthrobacter sp. UYCu723]